MVPTWLEGIRSDERWIKGIAVAAVCVLVTAAASIGEIDSRSTTTQLSIADAAADGGSVASGDVSPASDPATGAVVEGAVGITGGDPTAAPGETAPSTATPSASAGRPAAPAEGTSEPVTGGSAGAAPVPDFGLRTQGVTDEYVKFGISYNEASCGDSGVLEAMVGAAATGDIGKAIDAFTRHINDNGGINGRQWQVVIGDDGGGGCPEKALSAARYLVDDEKVFAVYPGLHDVADYVQSKHIPTYVGRDDPESLRLYGANGIGLTQEIGGVLEAWTAFGDYYLESGNTEKHKPCIVRPESGVSGDWDLYATIFHAFLDQHNIQMVDEVVFQDDVSTAQQQSTAAAARLKSKGCDQVYFMAINPIAPIFFTQAATQQQWFPTWTFTSYMVLADTDLGGSLQDQQQWDNAIGLSPRVPEGEHPVEGNCKRIYETYYPNDGQSESAAAQLVCAAFLTSAEMMIRGERLTGELTANSMLVGADSMRDYFYDAHIPLSWSFPGASGPFVTKAFRHYTIVDWVSAQGTYVFPEYPIYWEVMGPGKSGGIDLRSKFQ